MRSIEKYVIKNSTTAKIISQWLGLMGYVWYDGTLIGQNKNSIILDPNNPKYLIVVSNDKGKYIYLRPDDDAKNHNCDDTIKEFCEAFSSELAKVIFLVHLNPDKVWKGEDITEVFDNKSDELLVGGNRVAKVRLEKCYTYLVSDFISNRKEIIGYIPYVDNSAIKANTLFSNTIIKLTNDKNQLKNIFESLSKYYGFTFQVKDHRLLTIDNFNSLSSILIKPFSQNAMILNLNEKVINFSKTEYYENKGNIILNFIQLDSILKFFFKLTSIEEKSKEELISKGYSWDLPANFTNIESNVKILYHTTWNPKKVVGYEVKENIKSTNNEKDVINIFCESKELSNKVVKKLLEDNYEWKKDNYSSHKSLYDKFISISSNITKKFTICVDTKNKLIFFKLGKPIGDDQYIDSKDWLINNNININDNFMEKGNGLSIKIPNNKKVIKELFYYLGKAGYLEKDYHLITPKFSKFEYGIFLNITEENKLNYSFSENSQQNVISAEDWIKNQIEKERTMQQTSIITLSSGYIDILGLLCTGYKFEKYPNFNIKNTPLDFNQKGWNIIIDKDKKLILGYYENKFPKLLDIYDYTINTLAIKDNSQDSKLSVYQLMIYDLKKRNLWGDIIPDTYYEPGRWENSIFKDEIDWKEIIENKNYSSYKKLYPFYIHPRYCIDISGASFSEFKDCISLFESQGFIPDNSIINCILKEGNDYNTDKNLLFINNTLQLSLTKNESDIRLKNFSTIPIKLFFKENKERIDRINFEKQLILNQKIYKYVYCNEGLPQVKKVLKYLRTLGYIWESGNIITIEDEKTIPINNYNEVELILDIIHKTISYDICRNSNEVKANDLIKDINEKIKNYDNLYEKKKTSLESLRREGYKWDRSDDSNKFPNILNESDIVYLINKENKIIMGYQYNKEIQNPNNSIDCNSLKDFPEGIIAIKNIDSGDRKIISQILDLFIRKEGFYYLGLNPKDEGIVDNIPNLGESNSDLIMIINKYLKTVVIKEEDNEEIKSCPREMVYMSLSTFYKNIKKYIINIDKENSKSVEKTYFNFQVDLDFIKNNAQKFTKPFPTIFNIKDIYSTEENILNLTRTIFKCLQFTLSSNNGDIDPSYLGILKNQPKLTLWYVTIPSRSIKIIEHVNYEDVSMVNFTPIEFLNKIEDIYLQLKSTVNKDNMPVFKTTESLNNDKNLTKINKNKIMKNSMFNNIIEKFKSQYVPETDENIMISMDGNLCVKVKYDSVNSITNDLEIVSYPIEMCFKIPGLLINKPVTQIVIGDIVKFKDLYYKVIEIHPNGTLKVISYSTGTISSKKTVKDFIINSNLVKVVINFMQGFNFGNNVGGFGNNPLMLLTLMNDSNENEEEDDLLENIIMMSLLNPNSGVGFNINPMMMLMMKKEGGSNNELFKSMLMMNLMSGSNMNCFNNPMTMQQQTNYNQQPIKKERVVKPRKPRVKKNNIIDDDNEVEK